MTIIEKADFATFMDCYTLVNNARLALEGARERGRNVAEMAQRYAAALDHAGRVYAVYMAAFTNHVVVDYNK